METVEASVVEEDDKHFIEIAIVKETVWIPLSEDKPNQVKSVFNKLIERIKEGAFEIQLEEVGECEGFQLQDELYEADDDASGWGW